jgi:serine/threonine protein kinase
MPLRTPFTRHTAVHQLACFLDHQVAVGKKLGEGMFGSVCAGVVTGLVVGESTSRVAIKQLTATDGEVAEDFEQEIKIMKSLAHKTTHVVRLLGVRSFAKPPAQRLFIYLF